MNNIDYNNHNFFTYNNIDYFNINHKNIIDKLNYYNDINKIPNLIFYGSYGSGKKTILNYFINCIYNDKTTKNNNILSINCCHGKGNIKFIREELKLFANSIITQNNIKKIKCVILLNADYLTIDAQSSLRRLIESYNYTTRFFIVINNYEKIIKPLISRFCLLYIINPKIDNKYTNYYEIIKNNNKNYNSKIYNNKNNYLKSYFKLENCFNLQDNYTLDDLMNISNTLYSKGLSGLDIMRYIETNKLSNNLDNFNKYKLLFTFDNIVKEIRNEELILIF